MGIYYIPAWYQHHMYKKCPNYLDPALQFYKDENKKMIFLIYLKVLMIMNHLKNKFICLMK